MFQTPGHGSLPSGHSTESFVTALMLDSLRRGPPAPGAAAASHDIANPTFVQLMRIAERIAINRTVAGVHFPVDSAAGMVLAKTLAEFFIARFSGASHVFTRTFDGHDFEGDFAYEDIWMRSERVCRPTERICRSETKVAIPKSDILYHLWTQAVAEWRVLA
jgi:PAP2 superfamily